MSGDDQNPKGVPEAAASSPTAPDEDGWEAALAAMPNLPVTPAPADAAHTAQAPPVPMHGTNDVGSITAPMPPVAPLPVPQPLIPVPTASAPALHLQAQNMGPAIIVPQIPDYPRRKPQPLIGPVLSVYGALLWSFVLAGQFTTSWMNAGPMDERLALLTVFVATVGMGIIALRRAQVAAPTSVGRVLGRAVFAFVGAFIAWFATIFVAAIAGHSASRNHDVLIAMFLLALAVTATVLGPRLTSPGPHAAPSHGRKVIQVSFWAGLAVVTLIAGAELVSNG